MKEPFKGALEVARTATFSPDEWEAYERAKMAEQDARGALTVARQEGAAEGKRDALLRLLARAELVLTHEQRERITTYSDIATLDRWFDNALAAKTVAAVFA